MSSSFRQVQTPRRKTGFAWKAGGSLRWIALGGCCVAIFAGVVWKYRAVQQERLQSAEQQMAVVEDWQSLQLSPVPDDAVSQAKNQPAVASFLPEWDSELEEPPVHALHEEAAQGPRLLPARGAHAINRAGFVPGVTNHPRPAAWLKGTIEEITSPEQR